MLINLALASHARGHDSRRGGVKSNAMQVRNVPSLSRNLRAEIDAQVSAWGLNSIGENPDGLTHALGNIFVVALFFGAFGPNGRPEADLEFESFSSNQGASDRLQHVRWSPVVRQAFNEKWHDRSARFESSDGGARMPGLVHVLLKIDVGIAQD